MKRFLLIATVVLGLCQAAAAGPFYSENFSLGDGGCTTSIVGLPVSGSYYQWAYGTYGNGGSPAWRADGGDPVDNPVELKLTSPLINVPQAGNLRLEFDQLYNFEYDGPGGLRWDGGVLMVSANSGAFTAVPAAAFVENGYTGPIQSDYPWSMSGMDAFSGPSGSLLGTGQAQGDWLHTSVYLGQFQAGDTVQFQFRGGWDWYTAYTPGWVVDNVSLEAVPEPSAMVLALVGLAACGLAVRTARKRV